MNGDHSLTRRELLHALMLAGAAVSVAPAVAAHAVPVEASVQPSAEPVISFFMDQPYVDDTGSAVPYHAPLGMRSGEPAAHLDEAEFRALLCCQ